MRHFPLISVACLALISGLGVTSTAQAADAAPQVETKLGMLAGSEVDGIRRFFDIPYAQPPVGQLRWRAPRPALPWAGVRAARAFGPICAQERAGLPPLPMSEDCLTLNVWTPAGAKGPLPVMVWIHGGGFLAGSGREPEFDGTQFARKGVVLVTINYRVGPFGFLAHPGLTAEAAYHSSGNYGILDQILALKWIRANIAAFGGDARNVTIFGESAGSTAVSILQASPLARGLFDKAIGESTSQFDPDGGLIGRKDLKGAEDYGKAFGEKLGASTIAQLRALSMQQILSKFTFFWPTERDGYVLPDFVYNIFAQGKQADVPTLIGSNSDEGSTIKKDWVQRTDADAADYDRIYGGLADPLRQSATDAIEWQMRTWARLQATTGKAPTWLYWFDRAWPGQPERGAFHGGEMIYVFKTLTIQNQPWTDEDRALSNLMSDYWVNFARTGNPNAAGLPRWPRYDPKAPLLMRLSPDPMAIPTPRADVQAWLDRYFDARR